MPVKIVEIYDNNGKKIGETREGKEDPDDYPDPPKKIPTDEGWGGGLFVLIIVWILIAKGIITVGFFLGICLIVGVIGLIIMFFEKKSN